MLPMLLRPPIRRLLRCCVPVIAATLWLACADRAGASGIALTWDRCGAGGVGNKTFACDTNLGTDTLVVAFLADFNLPRFAHADVFMYVCFRDFMLPDWWQVLGTGGCRSGALTATAASPGAGCAPIWDPAGGSTQGIITGGNNVVNGFRFVVSVSVGDSTRALDMVAGQEYELARLALDHARTVGVGACAGCSTAADVGADFVWVYDTGGHAVGVSSGSYVTWQDASTLCRAFTPVKNRTWGQIKTLYR